MQIFAGLCLNCAVFGALLRPLELVAVKMPPAAVDAEERNEEEGDLLDDDEGNNFTVLLPDGTHHENVVPQPPLTPNSSFHSHQVRFRSPGLLNQNGPKSSLTPIKLQNQTSKA